MAFVYCDERWRKNKQNRQPGPGQYTIQNSLVPEKDTIQQRPFTSLSKKRNQLFGQKQEENIAEFKQWVGTRAFKKDLEVGSQTIENERNKSGKICRNVTSIIKKNEDGDEQRERKFKIKNEKGKTWGNTKIGELLNEHKHKEVKSQIMKKAFSTNTLLKNNIYAYQIREKLKQDLSDLEALFQVHKKKNEKKYDLKDMNREISAKHKVRQANSHNYSKFQKEQKLEVQSTCFYKNPQIQELGYAIPSSINNSKYLAKNDSMRTGCTDYLFQDSIEYIDDATPGPGSYSFNSSALNLKQKSKVQKFGVTMQRFKPAAKINQAQIPINPSYPDFKANSKARQQEVGFGKTTKQQKQKRPIHKGVFYEDCNTLQNKAKKMQEKGDNQKFVFGSCKQRFQYKEQKKNLEDDLQSENENLSEQKETVLKIKIPNNIFLSKVKRQFPINLQTQDVDYTGQNFNCLANKLKKQKQFYQDYEIKPAPFNSKEERFKSVQESDKNEVKVELKIQKVRQLKKKKQRLVHKQQKGFKFGNLPRQNSKEQGKSLTPSPTKYCYSPQWITSSYNIRFA